MNIVRLSQEYQTLPPLCQFMFDLIMAGMSTDAVVARGFEFAYHEREAHFWNELYPSGEERVGKEYFEDRVLGMRHCAHVVYEASRFLGIDLNSQHAEWHRSSR